MTNLDRFTQTNRILRQEEEDEEENLTKKLTSEKSSCIQTDITLLMKEIKELEQ